MKKVVHHNLPSEFRLQGQLNTDYGVCFFYDNIVVMEAKDGVLLSYSEEVSVLLSILKVLEINP